MHKRTKAKQYNRVKVTKNWSTQLETGKAELPHPIGLPECSFHQYSALEDEQQTQTPLSVIFIKERTPHAFLTGAGPR